MSKEPKRNVYVGHRYVPKVMGEWDKTESYEGLSIVTNKGTSYTSKKRVPKGIDILNEEYWVVTGNYNAQIEEYRKDVRNIKELFDTKSDITYVDETINTTKQELNKEINKKVNRTEYENNKQIIESNVNKNKDDINKLYNELELKEINVLMFNAKGDGVTDDTVAINNAIDYAVENNINTVYFPSGIYMIKADAEEIIPNGSKGGINLKSNITLKLDDNAILQAISNSAEGYNIIRAKESNNIKVIGGTIKGERSNHSGSEGEWGHGIHLKGCSNVYIQSHIIDCWGDGIYVGGDGSTDDSKPTTNLIVENTVCDNNRRQGISIVSGKHIRLLNSDFINTNGTLPESGIDIEPSHDRHIVRDVKVIDCNFNNNAGTGFLIDGKSGSVEDIYVNGIQANKNYRGIRARGIHAKNIELLNTIAKDNNGGYEFTGDTTNITLVNAYSKNNNRGFIIDKIKDLMIKDSFIEGIEIKANTENLMINNSVLTPLANQTTGFYFESTLNTTIKNSVLKGKNNVNGLRVLDSSYFILENCILENFENHAIQGTFKNSMIKNNTFKHIGGNTAETVIILDGYTNGNNITNNTIRPVENLQKPLTGITLGENVKSNLIANNDFYTAVTDRFSSGNEEENVLENNRK